MASGPSPKKIRSGGFSASTTARIASRGASGSPGLPARLPLLVGLLAEPVVGRVGGGMLRRGAAPVGGVRARLHDGDLDAEVGDLLGQGLAEALQRPLGGVVDADVREGADPPDARHR